MDLSMISRETYAVINLDNLEMNYRNLKHFVGESVEVACVIKADAYGHGSIEVARTLIECGVKYLAVACLSEALLLRRYFVGVKILVMGNIPDDHVKMALENDIIITVYDYEQGLHINEVACQLNKSARVHIKYDTGFNRLGFSYRGGLESIKAICDLTNIQVEGFFSHLALKDESSDREQFRLMVEAKESLETAGYSFDYYHICDSIAAVEAPDFHLNMIRPGAILYGLVSHRGKEIEVKQVMTLHTHLSRVMPLKAGDHVSYSSSYVAESESLVGTIPIGYADGYPRNLTNRAKVMIKGKLYPLVGRTCMDQAMVDLGNASDLKRGDLVTVYSDDPESGISIADIAKWGETNKNEIVARLSKRVPKVYVRNNQVVKVVDDLLG